MKPKVHIGPLDWRGFCTLYVYAQFVLRETFRGIDLYLDEPQDGLPPLSAGSVFGKAMENAEMPSIRCGLERLLFLCTKDACGIQGSGFSKGFLQSAPDSLVRLFAVLIREFCDPITVVERFSPVLDAYFASYVIDGAVVGRMDNPFTIANYERMLFISGVRGYAEIDRRSLPFRVLYQEYIVRSLHGRRPELPSSFSLPRENDAENAPFFVRGEAYWTDDTRLPERLFQERTELHVVLLCRRSSGQFEVFFRGQQDLSRIFLVLSRLWPRQWEVVSTGHQTPVLANVGAPSPLTLNELTSLLKEHVTILTRADRKRGLPVSR